MTNPSARPAPSVASRIFGCLAGGAVADAVGYEVEFKPLHAILAERGPGGVAGPSGDDLEASDDTQLSLFTAEGLVRALRGGDTSPEAVTGEVRAAYLDWLDTQGRPTKAPQAGKLRGIPEMRATRAPGMTCLSALAAGGAGTPGAPPNDSKGCGGVMRVAPLGLVPGFTPEVAFDLGCRAAAITHGHPDGWGSAGAMAAATRLVLGGAPIAAAALAAADLAAAVPGCEGTAAAIRRAVALSADGVAQDELTAVFGEGWVGEEALAIGVYAALRGGGFVDAVRIAATHSGDSDSTASIAGQLLGAAHGTACVPGGWFACLDLRDVVRAQAMDLTRAVAAASLAPRRL